MDSSKRFGIFLLIPILLWTKIVWPPTAREPFLSGYTTAKTTSANIIELANRFEQIANGIFIQGSYAYVGRETSLSILDISNPISPTLVGKTASFSGTVQTDSVQNIYVTNNYAYVTVGRGGLRIIDISNPAAPVEIGSYNTVGFVDFVEVANAYAYITSDYGSTVEIINTSIPTNPIKVAAIGYLSISNIEVAEDYLFVSDSSGKGGWTHVVDVSDPTNPLGVGSVSTLEYHCDVAAVGEYAYVSLGGTYLNPRIGGLQVMDIFSPTNPTKVGSYNRGWPAYNMLVDNYVYLLGEYGLRLIDISNPTNPVEVSFYNKQWNSYARGYDLAVADDYIYVAAGDEGLFIFRYSETKPLIDVTIDGPISGITKTDYRFTALVSPTTASLPITYTWAPVPDFGQGAAVATYTWQPEWFFGTASEASVSVMAVNANGMAIDTHTISIYINNCFRLYIPLVLRQDSNG